MVNENRHLALQKTADLTQSLEQTSIRYGVICYARNHKFAKSSLPGFISKLNKIKYNLKSTFCEYRWP